MISYRSDWNSLRTILSSVFDDLEIAKTTPAPISFLESIKSKVGTVGNDLRRQNLVLIGSVNFVKTLTRVSNTIDGVQYGLRTGDIENDRFRDILSSTKGDLMLAIQQIETKLDRQDVENFVQSAQLDRPVSQEAHDNFTDAMRSLMQQLQHSNGDEKTDSDKSNSRDLIHMSEIMKRNNDDLLKMRTQLNKASTSLFDNENFHLVTGPVLIGTALDVVKLKAAGIDFDTVYFPGIRYGFARKEETPRFYILRNQMLLAVLGKKPSRFQMNLKGKSVPQKMQDEKSRFKQISEDVLVLLHTKTGERYTQIGAEREKYITNKQFPGTRFMLLMKRSVFERIGPFGSSNTLELPF